MGRRSRKKKAQRAWILPWVMPLIRALAGRVQKARPRAAYRLAMILGTLFRWARFTRTIIRRNAELACGRPLTRAELRRFERAYYNHFALLLVEFLRQPQLDRETLFEQLDREGLEQVKAVYEAGSGVIFATGHVGSWELALHTAGLFGIPVEAVIKESGYAEIDAWAAELRGVSGTRTRDVKGSLWGLKKALDHGGAIGIVVDQEVRQGMIYAPFFGIPAACSSAPALLHLRTKAPIVVVTVQRQAPFRYRMCVEDEIRHTPTGDKAADMLAITTRINAALENALRRCPEQWLWSHRRWRRRPPDEPEPFARTTDAPGLDLRLP